MHTQRLLFLYDYAFRMPFNLFEYLLRKLNAYKYKYKGVTREMAKSFNFSKNGHLNGISRDGKRDT